MSARLVVQSALTSDERELLNCYRKADLRTRKESLRYVKKMQTRTGQLVALFETMVFHAQDHLLVMAEEYQQRWPLPVDAPITRTSLKLVPVKNVSIGRGEGHA